MERRRFMGLVGATTANLAVGATRALGLRCGSVSEETILSGELLSLRIDPIKVELSPGIVISTTGYNGQVPGPILRLREGVPVTVDVTNNTEVDELVHWHGLHIDSKQDGAMEEGTPMVPSHGSQRYEFVPAPSGTRWYHTHAMAKKDLGLGGYSGQFGFLYIEPKNEPGHYDREVFMAIHHWGPSMMEMGSPVGDLMVGYRHASFNDKLLGASEPIPVKRGDRVLFRFLNASGTQNAAIAMAGHQFTVIALDGNPVPRQNKVKVLELGVAERIDAIVEMDSPGIWVLGSTNATERKAGLGHVIEYAGSNGKPQWVQPGPSDWSYHLFESDLSAASSEQEPVETLTMVFEKAYLREDGMDRWMINGRSFPDLEPLRVRKGRRYRFEFMNASREAHPVHFHRHSFELKSIAGVRTSGIVKDTVVLPAYSSLIADFVANNPGPSLFHCHQQIHMDYGFMQLLQYV